MDELRVTAEVAGFFTRQDALAAGYDDRSIHRAVRARLWHRIRPGAYTFTDLWPDDPESRHRLTGRAVSQRLSPHVALSHTTAALEHGLLVWGADLSHTHVTRLDGGAGRSEAGVRHHEGLLLPGDLVTVDGHLVVNPVRAAVETAILHGAEAGLCTLDSLLHLKKGTPAQVDRTYALLQSWPGARPTRIPVRMADGAAESVGESRARYLFYAQGLPAPLLQYDVFDDDGRLIGTTDFAWPEHRALGEFDGRVKYGRHLRRGEQPGDAVFREKRREDRLCEQLGWRMVRLVWADLATPAATAARVRRILSVAA